MGGGAVVVLVGFSERVTGVTSPRWFFVSVVVILVVYASYLVWKDERTKVNSANATWANERAELMAQLQAPAAAVPEIEIEIAEAIFNPVTHNSLRCFLWVSVRNQTEGAPCMIHNCVLRIRIGDNWFEGGMISVNAFQLVTCDQLADPDDVPLNVPYHYEDHLPVIEIAREDLTDLRSIIGEEHPLRRGFPQTGWIGFVLRNLPNWPIGREETGGGEMEFDQETGEEKWVEDTVLVYQTHTIQEISLEVIDGHGEHHTANKLPQFGTWARRIAERRVVKNQE